MSINNQADLRYLIIKLLDGCDHCGTLPRGTLDETAKQMNLTRKTLWSFLQEGNKLNSKSIDKAERWVWLRLNHHSIIDQIEANTQSIETILNKNDVETV